MKNSDPRLYKASGLNSQFNGGNLSFSDYLQQTQAMLAAARIDLTPENSADILTANSPFSWRPHKFEGQRGILLIHGLFDSPFLMRDVARHFLARGFLVRSILLPGHGSVPGDLLGIQRAEWIKAVDYAVDSLQCEVQQVFIGGFSLGGALAVHRAQRDPGLAGLILLAPALGLTRNFWAWPLHCYSLLGSFFPNAKWFQRRPQTDYTKYESYTIDAIYQVVQLDKELAEQEKTVKLAMPLFIAHCAADEVVLTQRIVDFFSQSQHPASRMLLYATKPSTLADKRISHRSSAYPEDNILDFSHLALPTAPENPHYGAHGDYRDFLSYPNQQPPAGQVYLGPRSKELLRNHIIQRLTFNPDFMGLTRAMDKFLKEIP